MPKNKKQDAADLIGDDTVALATELTGLIPTPPGSTAETAAYTELASVPTEPPKRKKGEKKRPG